MQLDKSHNSWHGQRTSHSGRVTAKVNAILARNFKTYRQCAGSLQGHVSSSFIRCSNVQEQLPNWPKFQPRWGWDAASILPNRRSRAITLESACKPRWGPMHIPKHLPIDPTPPRGSSLGEAAMQTTSIYLTGTSSQIPFLLKASSQERLCQPRWDRDAPQHLPILV